MLRRQLSLDSHLAQLPNMHHSSAEGGLHKCVTEFHLRGLVLETFGQTAFMERQGEGKEGAWTMPRVLIR